MHPTTTTASPTDIARVRATADIEAVRERVLNVVGHELLTPVSTLRGLADALPAVEDEASRDVLTVAIQRNARRLESLVNDLLLAAGVSTALPTAEPAPVDVEQAALAAWTDGPGHSLRLNVRGPVRVLVDPVGFTRVLQHVFDNACAYGETPVTLSATVEGETAVIEVHSPGREVPAAELESATEAFYRGESAVMTQPGLGLGLAVARAVIEHERGSIGLLAREGGGVITRLEVPAA